MNLLSKKDLLSYISAKEVSPSFLETGSYRFRKFSIDVFNNSQLPSFKNSSKNIGSDKLRQKLVKHWQKHDPFKEAHKDSSEFAFMGRSFLIAMAYPEYIFPLGYNEFRLCNILPESIDIDSSVDGAIIEMVEEKIQNEAYQKFFTEFLSSAQYRTSSGVWHTLEGVADKILPKVKILSNNDWNKRLIENWRNLINKTQSSQNQKVWNPSTDVWFKHDSNSVREKTDILIDGLNEHKIALPDIHWRQLEELVAELLRRIGLKVMLTKKSHDGGRDIIAIGELIPGEPTKLAVEVKHKNVVGIADLRAALYANRHFPALLFATSGRFSAGIFKEQSHNQMRLFLKDGLALQQWLNAYALPNKALATDQAITPRGRVGPR